MTNIKEKNMDEAQVPAMSAQQKRFTSGKLSTYREFMVGNRGWPTFIAYEVYNLLFSGLPGVPGFGFRSFVLPFFLADSSARPTVGRGVLIRQPHSVSLAAGVIVDDYAVLDVRGAESSAKDGESSFIEIGEKSFIGRGSTIAAKGGAISLGKAVNISSDCRLATQTGITIGESTLIAAYCYIGPGNHARGDDKIPMIEKEMELKGGVSIGSHCWIGARATILDGVKIGDGAIVGAHSLVKENVPSGAVVAGCPAKLISSPKG